MAHTGSVSMTGGGHGRCHRRLRLGEQRPAGQEPYHGCSARPPVVIARRDWSVSVRNITPCVASPNVRRGFPWVAGQGLSRRTGDTRVSECNAMGRRDSRTGGKGLNTSRAPRRHARRRPSGPISRCRCRAQGVACAGRGWGGRCGGAAPPPPHCRRFVRAPRQ